jgi:hypothetical protein
MLRVLLVVCLLLPTAGGCATEHNSFDAGPARTESVVKCPSEGDVEMWLDDHPVLRGTLMITGVCALVVAGVAAALGMNHYHCIPVI